ncbi:NUDIX hydrolase [Lentzea sp. HUAS TT2]|uniref:NUDIX hydrolase n=1 Tax=Lentzea sp. HUAS TT2 TaxID=3447454 RepID=UPI003F71C701
MYRPSDFPPFAVTVDLVVLTVRGDELCALLVRRGEAPYRGRWALPGGFVQVAESVDAAAGRELVEETGVSGLHLEQLGTYGEPGRDPRMRVVSVAYLALAPDLPVPVAGTDAAGAAWVPVEEVSSLAFDHARILEDGVERARAKLEYTPLGTAFCGAEFTVAELRRVYEIVWGVSLDPRNFHRKVTGVAGLLSPTGESTSRDGGRPAALYRRGGAEVLYPPLVRAPVS